MPSSKDVALQQRATEPIERVVADLSELADQIRLDELADAEASGYMTPIDYAKARGIHPQRVYKALRDKKLQDSRCQCGRRVVCVADADELFKFRKGTEDDTTAGARPPEGDV